MRSLGRIYEAVEEERKRLAPEDLAMSPREWVLRLAQQAGIGAASISNPELFEDEMERLAALAIAAISANGRKS